MSEKQKGNCYGCCQKIIKDLFCCCSKRCNCCQRTACRKICPSDYETFGSGSKTSDYGSLESGSKKSVTQYQEEIQKLSSTNVDLHTRLQEREKEIKNLTKSKDDALSRLSGLMGTKLRDNNPAIADLNDPDRPMKLSEQFNGLYENEWTDAYSLLVEQLVDDSAETLTDAEAIRILLTILKEINDTSIGDSLLQISGLKESIQTLPDEDCKEYMKSSKDALKSQAGRYVPLLYKKITNEESTCQTVLKYRTYCQPYIEKCVKICYYAAVQDPPMFLDFEPPESFDLHVFKVYTQTGSKIDFLVWPALFLSKDGGLLSKGVVQPQKHEKGSV